ncbi:hypothetical protein N7528_009104 [Penicillium herquei]|nr:hypothetical protein N7528_009104 [Penicillium herquei]
MATTNSDRPRTRAKRACMACNARRVRCNVVEMHPCQNCVSWNLSCELGVSRRGKYPRRKKKGSESLDSEVQVPHSTVPGNIQDNALPYIPHASTCPTPADQMHETVFLGESSPLTCVVDENRRSPDKGYAYSNQKGRLHYAVPESRGTSELSDDQRRKILQDRLIRESALVFPSPIICDTLLQAYFQWFHPCFPILDRVKVQTEYQKHTISPLLLQAMLFIGVSLCSDTAFQATGYTNRYQAKGLFYQRAKEIYDVGWETNMITKLQSLFLLSFWRGGPSEERDVRFWLGAAISIAQKKGIHVMSKLSFLGVRDQRLWKRIWWALYVRDQQTSAALGLPSRIRDEDCEVAELERSDFEDPEDESASEIFRKPPAVHISYVIGMAQLASQYSPRRAKLDNASRPIIHERLSDWESKLPTEMQFGVSTEREVIFLVGMLHMTYNNLYVLLYRPIFLQPPSESTSVEGSMALEAATRSTRILEDMLSENLVQHGLVHLITHTFSALCIHTIHFGRVTGTARKLAEHRAKLCLLGLKELQKSWDLENWVLDLFSARDLRLADTGISASTLSSHITRGSLASGSLAETSEDAAKPSVAQGKDLLPLSPQPATIAPDDTLINMDWYELLNVEGDDFTGLAGSLTNPEYLNPQNLEFLYRFL